MSYEFKIEQQPDYLRVVVSGRETLADSKAGWQQIFAACREHGKHKVLVVEELDDTLSIGETYELVRYIDDTGLAKEIQVAFVDKKPMQYAINKFAETVANNRGFHGKVFFTEEAAQTWLTSD